MNQNRKNKRYFILDYKQKQGCVQCSENHPSCLEFHHLNVNEKKSSISKMVHNDYPWEKILKEIAKCIVLCKNCHAKLHWNEK